MLGEDQGPQAAPNSVYATFANYPFSEDQEFLDGLDAIIASSGDPQTLSDAQKEAIVGQAKAFYFSRKTGTEISWEGYLAQLNSTQRSPAVESSLTQEHRVGSQDLSLTLGDAAAAQPMSFAKLSQLIASGDLTEVPFNRVVPDALSEEKPSEPQAPVRKKPWEV